MSICLCNLSADAALELAAQKGIELTPASPDTSEFLADPALAKEVLGELAHKLPRPIELLVGNPTLRRKSKEVSYRVWKGSLPRNSIFAISENLYVSSPDFTLLQQASQLHQVKLCQMLGRYLGTWTPNPDSPFGQDKRASLTSFDSLSRFLARVGKAWGKSNLRFAMTYTCDGAASAPETSLQLAMCLPPALHGLGIMQPTMNYEVDLSAQARKLYPHDSIRIDLCWYQKKFGLEYQGEDHGTRLGEDYARWFAAQEEGYELWFVAKEQLESAPQMLHIARKVAERIGADAEPLPTESELQDLLDTLSGHKHPKPMGYQELRSRLRE